MLARAKAHCEAAFNSLRACTAAGLPTAPWFLTALMAPVGPAAAQQPDQWSVGPVLGVHRPQLSELNQGLFQAPLFGFAEFETDPNNEVAETVPFHFDAAMPPLGNAAKAGLEFQWQPNSRHALVLGIATLENGSRMTFGGELPVQKVMSAFDGERRAKISYTEYTVGWRFNMMIRPKFRLYGRLAAHEIFDIDYREDIVFEFKTGDLNGVRRLIVLEAQTAALFMGQAAVGGEWRLNDWFSIGLEGGYMQGWTSGNVRDATYRTDFTSTDRVNFEGMPFAALADGTLGYLPAGATTEELREGRVGYERLDLNFSGWQAMVRLAVTY